ncbi:MAG: hypothetical protein KatS3mg114_1000 [Planctomycetaceae bacterium]|nr:MAG: hypothetical protein KatS3mg114_1000 [Planctomycetaceae bacterium]
MNIMDAWVSLKIAGTPRAYGNTLGALSLVSLFTWSLLVGCWQTTSSPPSPESTTGPAVPPPPPLLHGWENPAAVVLLSADQMGYLEPCGCSPLQSGGLGRRASLERQLRERGWPVVGLDAGGLVKHSRKQDRIKLEAILNGLHMLNYQGVAAGVSELRFPPEELLALFTENEGVALGGMLLSSNVLLFGQRDLGVPKPWKLVSVGEIKLGVLAVLGEHAAREVKPEGVNLDLTLLPRVAALEEWLPVLQAEHPHVLLLLHHGTPEEARETAARFPQFHVILTTGGAEEPPLEPERVQDTLVVQVGHKGKHVGVLGIWRDTSPRFRWEVVQLDHRRFDHDPRMDALMRQYQQQLRDEKLAESLDLEIRHPTGNTYIGAEQCGVCHKKAYEKWLMSKHALAYESLIKGRKGEEARWISRIYDPECLACHVTGWHPQQVLRYTGGFVSAEQTPHLKGQQCENCHGPGSQHAEQEWRVRREKRAVDDAVLAARAQVKRYANTAEKELCIHCHDGDNSPNFAFKKYWEQIRHPWKD